MTLTPAEGHRLHVLTLLESRRITTAQAAEALGITPRQVRRLRGKLRGGGPGALTHGNRDRSSPQSALPAVRTGELAVSMRNRPGRKRAYAASGERRAAATCNRGA